MIKRKIKGMTTESRSPQQELQMKTNPQGTGVSHNIHHPQTGIIRRSRFFFYCPELFCPYSQVIGASFFRARPKFYVGSDAVSGPSAKAAFTHTWTAQPPCLSVTPSQGQTLHPTSPPVNYSQS